MKKKKTVAAALMIAASLILCTCVGCIKKQPAEQPAETQEDPVDAAVLSVFDKLSSGKALDRLSEPERVIYLVRELENAVCNGGFSSYYYNYGADHANEVADAFAAIGAPQTAELCRKANSVFGEEVPSDWDERWDRYKSLTEDDSVGKMWEECDDAFYASLEDLHRLARAYVQANAAAFGK